MAAPVFRAVFSICVVAALSSCSPFSFESKFVALSKDAEIVPGRFTVEVDGDVPRDRDVSVCFSTPGSLQVGNHENWRENLSNSSETPSISAYFVFVPGGEIEHDAFLPAWFREVQSSGNVVAYYARPRKRPPSGSRLARVILYMVERETFPLVFVAHRPVL
jgi:hypothetical protein